MCSLEVKVMEEDHTGKRENKSYREQEITAGDIEG